MDDQAAEKDEFAELMADIEGQTIVALVTIIKGMAKARGIDPLVCTGPMATAIGRISRELLTCLKPIIAQQIEECMVAHLRGGLRDAACPINEDGSQWRFQRPYDA